MNRSAQSFPLRLRHASALLAALIFAAPFFAAVDGQVINRTTDQPLAAVDVVLYRFGEAGPQLLESVKTDAQGRFRFTQDVSAGVHMVQVVWDQVTYNKMLNPGAPASNLLLEAFQASPEFGEAKIDHLVLLLEATSDGLAVSDSYNIDNPGKRTFYNPKGGIFRFFVPPQHTGVIRVRATAPGSIPLDHSAEKTSRPNEYTVNIPIRPGQTRLDVSYQLPAASPLRLEGKRLYPTGETRLVVPAGVIVEGDGLQPLGRVPQSSATIYAVNSPAYAFSVSGSGSLRAPAAESDSGASIRQIRPRIYDQVYTILALLFIALLCGFILLYRKGSLSADAAQRPSRTRPS